MKILVVEDDGSSRQLLKMILEKKGYEVDVVNDGLEALEFVQRAKYDAVLTDWMMPKLDGIALIRRIREVVNPVPIIMVITALASKEARIKALDAGADDYIAKPIEKRDVLERLKNCLMRQNVDRAQQSLDESKDTFKEAGFAGVCLTASTGGQPALLKILTALKADGNTAYFIVLQSPGWMLESFAERLRQKTNMIVHLGEDNQRVLPDRIYIAPDDFHMTIDPQTMTIQLNDNPPENMVRPSADPLFRSVSKTFGKHSISVVLTGMGHDGTIGSGYISAAGGLSIAQEPSEAIMPSMPKSVIDLRIASIIAPIEDMPAIISNSIHKFFPE
ncbi:MAG: chemotaxis protein CheB [Ignavibacteria bacterium]|jgi:two-component system chemotaxis response regulator CheB